MDKQPRICPWVMIFVLYALAILSTIQLSGAIYLLSTGIVEILCIWELALGILSSCLSCAFLGFHLFLARRYQKPWFRRTWKPNLSRACLIVLSLGAFFWFVTLVFGLIIALRPKRNLRRQPGNSGRYKISDSIFQEVSFVGPLLTLLVTVFLCCLCGVTHRLFSASLQGTQDFSSDQEDQVNMSRKPLIGEVETYPQQQPEHFRQDSHDYFCWSPQCATPQPLVPPPKPPQHQTQMRPRLDGSPFSSQAYPTVPRNRTYRKVFSVYGHGKSCSSFAHSRHSNSRSFTSDAFRRTKKVLSRASSLQTVPKVSQKCRRDSPPRSQNSGKPSRPSTRPSMPPAAFWLYAAEKSAGRAIPGSLQSWQFESDRRKREPSICRYPIIATRPETVVTRNKGVHHSNHRAAKRRSYESIRKGISDLDAYRDDILSPDLGDGWGWEDREVEIGVQNRDVRRRSQCKRLVKKRQPWSAEHRRKSRNRI